MPIQGKIDPQVGVPPELQGVIPTPGQEALQEPGLIQQMLLGALLGSVQGKWPVQTIGQETGQLGRWLEQLGTDTSRMPLRGTTQGNAEYLRRMIEEHGIPARLDGNGNLWAINTAHGAKQGTVSNWERIEPTMEAVRSWLGY